MTYFGTNIKKIRQIKGLSQNSFAELLDLNRGVISSYEDGRAEPKIETVLRIADYFKIPMNDLLSKALTVNQLVNFSDFEETISKEVINKNDKLEILANSTTVNLDLQKIFAKFDFIYEVDEQLAKRSIYSTGTILFLKKTSNFNKKGSFIIIGDNSINFSEKYIPENECYTIVGTLQVDSIFNLSDILNRIEILEKKVF
jgi:transcriptional regulator with XRE-family HTH domain